MFSAPYALFSDSPFFAYQIQTDYHGFAQEYVQGSTVPEPATWAMMLLGFVAGYRESRKRASLAG
jgi:hypothetical protein